MKQTWCKKIDNKPLCKETRWIPKERKKKGFSTCKYDFWSFVRFSIEMSLLSYLERPAEELRVVECVESKESETVQISLQKKEIDPKEKKMKCVSWDSNGEYRYHFDLFFLSFYSSFSLLVKVNHWLWKARKTNRFWVYKTFALNQRLPLHCELKVWSSFSYFLLLWKKDTTHELVGF